MSSFAVALIVLLAVSLAGFAAGGGFRRGRLLWLAVPLCASLAGAALYSLKTPAGPEPAAVASMPALPAPAAEPMTPLPAGGAEPRRHDAGDMGAMAAKLAARLEKNPDDGPGWALLARAYAWMGRYAEADAAFARAAALKVDDPKLKADWDAARAKAAAQ
jgi:cytochrome c-type biogenesis protein CcmH